MAKGAGMLAPGLATMLVVITTDAVLSADERMRICAPPPGELRPARLRRLHVDERSGDADGQRRERRDARRGRVPCGARRGVHESRRQLQADAEGASHDITIRVVGAASEDDAVEVGRSVARNNLFKAAIFGNDPNWGRVLAAIGTTQAAFDPYAVDVSFNGCAVQRGAPTAPRGGRPHAACDGRAHRPQGGRGEATIFTNDLTHDYVHENSAYSS
jgi:glutamate N-acetyltransferase/amino-acid N-acetyltransferase